MVHAEESQCPRAEALLHSGAQGRQEQHGVCWGRSPHLSIPVAAPCCEFGLLCCSRLLLSAQVRAPSTALLSTVLWCEQCVWGDEPGGV